MSKNRRTLIRKLAGVSLAAARPKDARASVPERSARRTPQVHCVITGQKTSGKSVIVSHSAPQPITVAMMPGYEFYRLWGNDGTPELPSDGSPTGQPRYFPSKTGFRFGMFTLPPATTATPQPPSAAALEETRQKLPGILEVLEMDHPGMHTTDTVDFDVVVFGEVVMELDDGVEVLLKAGDCVIQNGTRHAWHNRSSEPCLIAFSLIGSERKHTK